MLTQGLLFGTGLAVLYLGAEALVAGAMRVARALGVSALVIGLTVVAFGTSTPELVVSILSAVRDTADVALGNVVGSNIANIALILGLSALIRPLRVEMRLVAREIPLMIIASGVFLFFILDGRLGRAEGLLLMTGFVGFVVYVLTVSRRSVGPEGAGERVAATTADSRRGEGRTSAGPAGWVSAAAGRTPALLLLLLGLGGLVAGAHLLVESAIWFARAFGVSDLVVGLTVVAVGTSLPELATSGVAALRGETDVAVGNIVGSNLFNLLAILGCAALVRPLTAAPELLRFQGPVMLGSAVLLLPLAWTRFELHRWEGGLLLLGYGVFVWVLLAGGV